jgi:hypothetical protein
LNIAGNLLFVCTVYVCYSNLKLFLTEFVFIMTLFVIHVWLIILKIIC